MKKLLVATLVLMALNLASFAQKKGANKIPKVDIANVDKPGEIPVTEDDKKAFLKNSKIKTIIKYLGAKINKEAAFLAEGTTRIATKDDGGKVDMMQIVFNVPKTDKGTVQIVLLKNNITNEERVWAENGVLNFTLIKNEVEEKPIQTVDEFESKYFIGKQNPNGIITCIAGGLKAVSSTIECGSCIQSVKYKGSRWSYFKSLIWNCGFKCTVAVISWWALVLCILSIV